MNPEQAKFFKSSMKTKIDSFIQGNSPIVLGCMPACCITIHYGQDRQTQSYMTIESIHGI